MLSFNKSSKKIVREKIIVEKMIRLYCKHKLRVKDIPEEYKSLIEYAHHRLDRCRYGENKTACKKCPTHCYKAEMREKIRAVMRWAGPRMIIYDPISAIRHLLGC